MKRVKRRQDPAIMKKEIETKIEEVLDDDKPKQDDKYKHLKPFSKFK